MLAANALNWLNMSTSDLIYDSMQRLMCGDALSEETVATYVEHLCAWASANPDDEFHYIHMNMETFLNLDRNPPLPASKHFLLFVITQYYEYPNDQGEWVLLLLNSGKPEFEFFCSSEDLNVPTPIAEIEHSVSVYSRRIAGDNFWKMHCHRFVAGFTDIKEGAVVLCILAVAVVSDLPLEESGFDLNAKDFWLFRQQMVSVIFNAGFREAGLRPSVPDGVERSSECGSK